MSVKVQAAALTTADLGEGPVWDPMQHCLYWVDITAGAIHRYRPDFGDEVIAVLDVPVVAVAPRSRGGLVVAAGMGFATLSDDATLAWIAKVSHGDRMNDGKVDPAGRLLAGTLTSDRSPGAALYRLDPNGEVTTLLTGVTLSNGLGWSPSGELMYYIDTPTRRVDVFDYDVATGEMGNRRTFVEIGDEPGNPDGLTVDADGGVWVVLCRGKTVRRFTPDGKVDLVVDVPASRATSCAFGGREQDTLFITGGRFDMTDEELAAEPLAGSLLSCRPGFVGLPATPFGT
jgi:sugar lactone lactonase YvrE